MTAAAVPPTKCSTLPRSDTIRATKSVMVTKASVMLAEIHLGISSIPARVLRRSSTAVRAGWWLMGKWPVTTMPMTKRATYERVEGAEPGNAVIGFAG